MATKKKSRDGKFLFIDYGQIPPQKYKLDKREVLYRYIENRYEPHIIAEAAANAIAKKRAKGPFSSGKATEVFVVVVDLAKKNYNKEHEEKLPPFSKSDKHFVADHLYATWADTIRKLTSYYKKSK